MSSTHLFYLHEHCSNVRTDAIYKVGKCLQSTNNGDDGLHKQDIKRVSETNRDRDRQTETESKRQTEREGDRERKRNRRNREGAKGGNRQRASESVKCEVPSKKEELSLM